MELFCGPPGHLQLLLGGGGGEDQVSAASDEPLVGVHSAAAGDRAIAFRGIVVQGIFPLGIDRLHKAGINRIQGGGAIQAQKVLPVKAQGGLLLQADSFGAL